jgi:ubiquinone/menaquinone biosynthesis C-methylase UbiE
MVNIPDVFTPVADDYARYRPGYPMELLDEIVGVCGVQPTWQIADIGSGTGNLARLFLQAGYPVIGVEPNREMREAAECQLACYPAFRSLDGTAEHIPLADHSIDLITVGQAIHWFDIAQARNEFLRILRPGGWVAVTWNDGAGQDTAFAQAYRAIKQTYAQLRTVVCDVPLSTGVDSLFGAEIPRHASFPHTQRFDLPGFLGRIRSSGVLPQPGVPGCDELTHLLTDLFSHHQQDGKIVFHYMAQLYLGPLI